MKREIEPTGTVGGIEESGVVSAGRHVHKHKSGGVQLQRWKRWGGGSVLYCAACDGHAMRAHTAALSVYFGRLAGLVRRKWLQSSIKKENKAVPSRLFKAVLSCRLDDATVWSPARHRRLRPQAATAGLPHRKRIPATFSVVPRSSVAISSASTFSPGGQVGAVERPLVLPAPYTLPIMGVVSTKPVALLGMEVGCPAPGRS